MRKTSVVRRWIGACGLAIAAAGYAVADEPESYQGVRLSFMEHASMSSFSVCVHDQGEIAVRRDAADRQTIAMLAMYACEPVLDGIAESIGARVGDPAERRDTLIAMRLEAAIEAYTIAGRLLAERTTP
ncbi:MAG: hypothetical protein ACE5MM_01060 [Nitrospiraceae bacterium]